MCMICWKLWQNRNDIIWNQRSVEPFELVQSAELVFNQWRNAQDKSLTIILGL